jgi:hypothetical protein
MHTLDKTALTMSAQTEPGHAFIKHVDAIEKHCTVEQRAVFAGLAGSASDGGKCPRRRIGSACVPAAKAARRPRWVP